MRITAHYKPQTTNSRPATNKLKTVWGGKEDMTEPTATTALDSVTFLIVKQSPANHFETSDVCRSSPVPHNFKPARLCHPGGIRQWTTQDVTRFIRSRDERNSSLFNCRDRNGGRRLGGWCRMLTVDSSHLTVPV